MELFVALQFHSVLHFLIDSWEDWQLFKRQFPLGNTSSLYETMN